MARWALNGRPRAAARIIHPLTLILLLRALSLLASLFGLEFVRWLISRQRVRFAREWFFPEPIGIESVRRVDALGRIQSQRTFY